MILWTIQPDEVFDEINRLGVYRCDINKSGMKDFADLQYDWLVSQMRKRIGPPPEGVSYPVWAYKIWYAERVKPDIRALRWFWGGKRNKFYRLEIDIPDEQVLLSDYNAWSVMLNEGLLSDTEEEDNEIDKFYETLSPDARAEFRSKNWERVFNVTPLNDKWTGRGETVQATFWELKKEQIRKVTMFLTTQKRRS